MAEDYLNSPGFNLAFPRTIEEEPAPSPMEGPSKYNALEIERLQIEKELAEIELRQINQRLSKNATPVDRAILNENFKQESKNDEEGRWSRLAKAFTQDLGSVADEVFKAGREAALDRTAGLGGMTQVGQPSYAPEPAPEKAFGPETLPQHLVSTGVLNPQQASQEFESVAIPTIDDPMLNVAFIAAGIGTSARALRAAGYSGKAFKVELAKEIGDWITGIRSLKNMATAPIKAVTRGVAAPKMEALRTAGVAEDIYKIPHMPVGEAAKTPQALRLGEEASEAMSTPKGVSAQEEQNRRALRIMEIEQTEKGRHQILADKEAKRLRGLEWQKGEQRFENWFARTEGFESEAARLKLMEQGRQFGVPERVLMKAKNEAELKPIVEQAMFGYAKAERIKYEAYQKEWGDELATVVSPKVGRQKSTKAQGAGPEDLANKYGLDYKGREQQGLGDVKELERIYGKDWKKLTDQMLEESPHWFTLKEDPSINVYIKPSELTEEFLASRVKAVSKSFQEKPTIGITAPTAEDILSKTPEEAFDSVEEYLKAHPEKRWGGGEAAGTPTTEPTAFAGGEHLDEWAKQVKAELDSIVDNPEKGSINIDTTAFANGLSENWVKLKTTAADTARDLRAMFRSPQYASKDPFYKQAFDFHHKNYWMKQRVADSIMYDFAKVNKGLSDTSQVRIFDALENPVYVKHLTDKELKAYEWTKKFYDNYFDLFVEIKAGDKAPLIKNLAKSLEGQKVDLRQVKREFKLTNDQVRALEVARRKVDNYAPHIFNRAELQDILEKRYLELLHKGVNEKNEEFMRVKSMINDLKKGEVTSIDFLPSNLKSKYFDKRSGLSGYQRHNKNAVTGWLKGWLREVYDDPSMKLWNKNLRKMEPAARESARALLRDYLGITEKSALWGTIKNLEYMRIFGLNLSSAAVNLLQQVNTIADAGPIWSAKGYAYAMSKEGKRLWAESGLAQSAYEYMHTGEPLSEGMTKLRSALSVFHRMAETANRKHAYLTYLMKGAEKFKNPEDLHWYAASKMFQTQFEYGPFGMPKAMRGWRGLATQFWSFPIKSVENIATMAKENPKALLSWLALYEGGQYAVREYLDLDLSNQLGFGVSLGEAFQTIREASQGDMQAALAHYKLMWKEGSGIIPSASPVIDLVLSTVDGFREMDWKKFKDNLTPVAWKKMMQFKEALKYGSGDRYPIYEVSSIKGEREGSPKYFLTFRQLLSKTFFFKPNAISREQKLLQQRKITDDMYTEASRNFATAIVQGNTQKLNELMSNEHIVVPSRQSVKNSAVAEVLSPAERLEYLDKQKKFKAFNEQLMGE